MGWLVAVAVALVILGALALALPAVFGVALAGLLPLLIPVALIGLGGIWWRHSRSRIDPQPKADQPDASMEDERP